jgi:fermentation-respiration switch protein FrsA (DUF1100 family)
VETFVDTHRPTAANGDAPAAPSRTLVTDLWYPERGGTPASADGPFPLVVFGHGFTASPDSYEGVLRTWASAGYVVAAPAFPLSNGNAPGGPTQNDVPSQPGDLSFVITQVVRLGADPASPMHGLVDGDHVGAAGHSMGAVTTMGVALNTCCADNRIGAAVVMSGFEGTFPAGSYTATDRPPVLFLHGDHDESISASSGLTAFYDARPPKYFVTLLGADHGSPFGGSPDRPEAQVVLRATVDFLDRYLKGSADGLDRLRKDADVPGVATLQAVER